ncbi:MAG TPA: hypothetical protein DDZ80_07580 [Cyanobacteria bacterium UBA8803]|nr:hypothetical protein [Cyanobacteria bacterium UBA9273]HBL58371.1 hypothetical protein [Cyanobacteria bacterium UBA8803]
MLTTTDQTIPVKNPDLRFSMAAMSADLARPTTLIYDFKVFNLDGPLAGNSYKGCLKFNCSSLKNKGEEYIRAGLRVRLLFENVRYTEQEFAFFPPEIGFYNGIFKGLTWRTRGLSGKGFVIQNEAFEYSRKGFRGIVAYSLRPNVVK